MRVTTLGSRARTEARVRIRRVVSDPSPKVLVAEARHDRCRPIGSARLPTDPFASEWPAAADPTWDGEPFGDVSTRSPPRTSRAAAFERRRPGVFETEDVQSQSVPSSVLLRRTCRHPPIRALHAVSRRLVAGGRGEPGWVEASKCGKLTAQHLTVRKSHRIAGSYPKRAGYFKTKTEFVAI